MSGQKITIKNGELQVPDNPIIPFIEGDGTGPDIWAASVRVIDAAVEKAYGGKKKIEWREVLAGEKNVSSSQLALAWIMSKGILPIPGTKRRKYLEQNIAATAIQLNEADLAKLESIVPLGTDTGKPYDEFSMGLID